MTNANRRVFAYAPLRVQSNAVMKAPLRVAPSDWYDGISEESIQVIDASASALFSLAGAVMIYVPYQWFPKDSHIVTFSDPVNLTGMMFRFLMVLMATSIAYGLFWAAQRLNLVEFFESMKFWMPMKLLATALLAWGAFFLFNDTIAGLIPMSGLTVIAIMVLFHAELKGAIMLALLFGLCGLPILLMV